MPGKRILFEYVGGNETKADFVSVNVREAICAAITRVSGLCDARSFVASPPSAALHKFRIDFRFCFYHRV